MEIKIVTKKFNQGICSEYIDILYVKDSPLDWTLGDIRPSENDSLVSEWIAKFLNSWSSKYYNDVEKDVESYDCDRCGYQETTTIKINFDNKNLHPIEEYYDTHFGNSTKKEDIVAQWAKNNIKLEIIDDESIDYFWSKKLVEDNYETAREKDDGCDIKDNYHTMSELYFNRMVMFDIITKIFNDKAWKSKLHDDGTMFDGYFIVGVDTPEGQFTYHYDLKYWDMFTCKEVDKAPKYDGHQPKDIYRLYSLL